jgi:uncharacterized protein (DUF1800 family)
MRIRRIGFPLLFSALLALFASTQLAAQSITVTPAASIVAVGKTLQFKATVAGLSNTAVTWEVNNVAGGSTGTGTISKTGLYTAPATLPIVSQAYTIAALGSDGKTRGTIGVTVQVPGPPITSVAPSPLHPGTYTAEIHGTGFTAQSKVRNGTALLSVQFGNATLLYASGAQSTTTSAVFSVSNPGTEWSNSITVPFTDAGAVPAISPKTVYIHLGGVQTFTAKGATLWSTTAGTITQTGLFVAPSTMPASKLVTVTAAGPYGIVTAQVTLASGANQAIAPASATVTVGEKFQFTSPGSTVWTAVYGTITSAGLYTAPAVWPVGAADTITVNGPQGWGSEKIVISPPTPAITSVNGSGHITYGLFTATIVGTNFSPASAVEMLGVGLPVTYSNGVLTASGFAATQGPATIRVVNGSAGSQSFPVNIGWNPGKASPAASRRFLEQAAFGPTPITADNVQALGEPAWLTQQLSMLQKSTYSTNSTLYGNMPQQFLTNAVNQPDQLRQRVAFALSQIFVTSLDEVPTAEMVSYQNMLLADAFTNYSQIMLDVTQSSSMGEYLNIANNAKADPTTGTLANENYAREMMQLFTLGTSLVNQDGSVQVDSYGIPLPTYSQFQVTEFARVYTGWTYAPAPGTNPNWNAPVGNNGILVSIPAQHDTGSKQLLNGYVMAANLNPLTELKNAINNIFTHPNCAPFVSTLLIQHLVKSNPSPAYVSRVAAVFANNGSGVRGDMKAIITAILMDPEARANDEGGDDLANDGHLQEPALFIAGMVRAFGGSMNDYNNYYWDLSNLGQNVFSSPSVFNYYAPNYGVPGTNLTGGEFQIYSPNAAVMRANEVSGLFGAYQNTIQTYGPGTSVNLGPLVYLATNPTSLVNALDLTLTHGKMPAEMKETIVTAVAGESGGNLRRVQRAVYLIMSSGYYNVWH